MEFYRVLNASLEKSPTTTTWYRTLDQNGIEDELFKEKLTYHSENYEFIEPFYERFKLKTEEFFPASKQSTPDDEKTATTQT